MFNQLTGQSFVSQYGAIFVKSLNSLDPFTFVVISRSIMLVGPIITLFLIDRWGRRPLYFLMGSLVFATLFTMGGLGVGDPDAGERAGIVAMVILFGSFYSGGFGAIGATVSAEVPHLRLRDKVSQSATSLQWKSLIVG
jgi:MFS family permease